MEESVTLQEFLAYYKRCMKLEPVDVRTYSPLVLAYIGDAVYELVVRAKVVNAGNIQVNKLHKHSSALVKASAQAALVKELEELLTQEERSVYRRGRNARSATMAKNATMIDYRMATGLEALVGWLFLAEEFERLLELLGIGLERLEHPRTEQQEEQK